MEIVRKIQLLKQKNQAFLEKIIIQKITRL